jgi:4a-hydroxytetrahydrobiopterin dehydratase
MSAPVLDEDAVRHGLASMGGRPWELLGGKLVSTVVCSGFPAALTYVGAVGRLAEEADHHPDIDIRYNRVTLALTTHDSGGITQLDLDLAERIGALDLP